MSVNIDDLSPPKKLHNTPARKDGASGQRINTTMAGATDRTRKQQMEFPLPVALKKRPRRGPFDHESSDDNSDVDNDSPEDDDSSLQKSGNSSGRPKMAQPIPIKGRVPMPSRAPPVIKRWDIRDMRRRMLAMQGGKALDHPPNPSAPLASNIQATRKHDAKAARQEDKYPQGKSGLMQRPNTPAPLHISSTAPREAFTRPPKGTPDATLRTTNSIPVALELFITRSQPGTMMHPIGTGISRSSDNHSTKRIKSSVPAMGSDARRPAQPREQSNIVSDLLGDIRHNREVYDSPVGRTTSTPAVIRKSSQKTPVHRELRIPSSMPATHVSGRSKNETRVGSKPEQADMSQRRLGVTPEGRGLTNSVDLDRALRHSAVTPTSRHWLPTPKTASPAPKRKIDDSSIEPGHIEPLPKRPAMSATSSPHTSRSESQVLATHKSIGGLDTGQIAMPKPTSSHARLEATPEVMKPTTAPEVTFSFIPSRQSSISAPSARRSIPAEAIADQNLKQQAKPRKSSEVPRAIAESASATSNDITSSRANSVATEASVSRVKTDHSAIASKPNHLEDDRRIMKPSTHAPRPENQSNAPGGIKNPKSATQKPVEALPVKESKTPSAPESPSPVIDERSNTTSRPGGSGKSQQGVAPNKSLEVNKKKRAKKGIALAIGAETASKFQDEKASSTLGQKTTSKSSVGPETTDAGASRPKPNNSKTPEAAFPADIQHSEYLEKPVLPEAPKSAESRLLLDPKPASSLLPVKQQATKSKEPAATPAIPKIVSIPSRKDVPSPEVESTIDLSTVAALPRDAEPFFEYSVLQKVYNDADDASSNDGLVLSSSYTNIEEANEQAKRVFDNMREQYQQHFAIHFSEATSKRNKDGCDQLIGTFAPVDHPSKQNFLKVWVRRATVSQYAGQTPKDVKYTSFITKTVYVIRLFKLHPKSTDSDGDNTAKDFVRLHHPHLRTECYTTLTGANRAAKNLQIELSHKARPIGMDQIWQAENLADLNKKMMDLEAANDGEEKYWKSEFNGRGLGSDKFELLVDKVGLCGPRNL